MRVAFLGLGRMGAPMAARLAAFDLTVWNRTPRPERVPPEAVAAPTVRAAVTDADVVVTMVADGDVLSVRYGDIVRLMHDLRGMGAGNILATQPPALTRDVLMRAAAHFAAAADPDGRTAEQMAIIYLSGWKPDPSQAAPAKRGSATVSLAAALKGKG